MTGVVRRRVVLNRETFLVEKCAGWSVQVSKGL